MNFELLEERIIEDLFEEEVFEDRIRYHFPRMNPYNVAPWNIGWYPRVIDREFRNRYYFPRRRNGYWPMSRRNQRKIHNPTLWLPLHIREQNYRRFHQASQQLVTAYQEKTQYLMNLFNQLEENHQQAMPLFNSDRSKEVDFLATESILLMAKFRQYGKT